MREFRLAALAAACGGGMAIAWLLVRAPADGRLRVVPPTRHAVEAPAGSADLAAPIVAVVVEEPRVEAAPTSAASEQPEVGALPAEAAAGAAIAALAASLRDPQWRRAAWEVEVAATGSGAATSALDEVERRLGGRDELDDDAFVAAAELLRAGGRPVDFAAERLRRIAFAIVEEDPVSLVAARALAACGDDGDRERLLDRACDAEVAAQRSSAQWALAAAPADRLLPLAVGRLEPGLAVASSEALLVAIDGALRRVAGTGLEREVAGDAAAAIDGRLADADADPRVLVRARGAGKLLARACAASADPVVRELAERRTEPPR